MNQGNQDRDFVLSHTYIPIKENLYTKADSGTSIEYLSPGKYGEDDESSTVSIKSPLVGKSFTMQHFLGLNYIFGITSDLDTAVIFSGTTNATHGRFVASGTVDNSPLTRITSYSLKTSTLPLFIDQSLETYIKEIFTDDLGVDYLEGLKSRLLTLSKYELEEDELPISLGSLKFFIGFIKDIKPDKPSVVVTSNGFMQAQWKIDNSNLLTIIFKPEGEISFLLFNPNPRNPQKIRRISGAMLIDELVDSMEPLGIAQVLVSENSA